MGEELQEMIEYVEPKTREQLVEAMKSIEVHLADRDRTVNGVRMAREEYWQWRKKAAFAMRCKVIEVQRLKEWLRAHPVLDPDALGNARRAFYALGDHVQALEIRVRALEEENARLRTALEAAQAPPAG